MKQHVTVAALCAAVLFVVLPAQAGRLDTIRVYSAAMDTTLTALVAVPDGAGPFPVVYLLHGYSGGAFDWENNTDLVPFADAYGMIIVCPDASTDSWYFDSPLDPKSQYETFVGGELPAFIESTYPASTLRGITGLSMGGHGALFLGLRHPGRYVAAASMSGGLDLRYNTTRWAIRRHLGEYADEPQRWAENSVSVLAARVDTAGLPALLIDCGRDDFFIEENRLVHRVLSQRQIPHDYIERPGGHTWSYWVRVLPYHLLFFREHFDRATQD